MQNPGNPSSSLSAPSMKVPPKRKGNAVSEEVTALKAKPSMKVPPKRKGNLGTVSFHVALRPSMKVPPKRKGNDKAPHEVPVSNDPSMKVPPKRKGNLHPAGQCAASLGPQ